MRLAVAPRYLVWVRARVYPDPGGVTDGSPGSSPDGPRGWDGPHRRTLEGCQNPVFPRPLQACRIRGTHIPGCVRRRPRATVRDPLRGRDGGCGLVLQQGRPGG